MAVHILGISALYHDSAACLVRDGEVVAAAQEERFTRQRHDAAMPARSIAYCLREAGISATALDHVCFYEKPAAHFARIIETHLAAAPRGLGTFVRAVPLWLREKLRVAALIEEALGAEADVLFTEHHHAHAASAFFASPFERAAIVTLDGVGEHVTASLATGEANRITLDREIHFPHSLGLFYSAFTAYLGFRVNSGEYKLMGLAPYGTPRFRDVILRELLDLRDDGSFRLNLRYFDFVNPQRMTNARFHALFGGPPREPDSEPGERERDLAASVQSVLEEAVVRICRDAHRRTGMTDLCLAGGVALNCSANGRVLREDTGFRRVFVQPAAGDAGGAIGAALATWHEFLGRPRDASHGRDRMRGAKLGPSYDAEAIEAALKGFRAVYTRFSESELTGRVARLLADGAVVGWFQGRMEFGPRALGSRSILADPRDPEMKEKLNVKIKFRESFRPFAPSVRVEEASRWFELDAPSPYMLVTFRVRDGAGLPAVTHVDGSARAQTVSADEDPRFHALLTAFGELTGRGVLVNTSFNVRGEPIVCAPEEAYRCFMRTSIDHLAIGDFLLDRAAQPPWTEGDAWRLGIAPD